MASPLGVVAVLLAATLVVLASGVEIAVERVTASYPDEALSEKSYETDERIVVTETDITNHPYQISLQVYDEHLCGGSIIDSYHVLTAAHCIAKRSPFSRYNIRAGSSLRNAGGVVHEIAEMTFHEKYRELGWDYDVAVVKLATPLEFSNAVQPVTLVEQDEELPEGTLAVTTGWDLHADRHLPSILQEVEMPLLTKEVCENYYPRLITDRMICTGFKEGGRGPCQYDSGGPLVSNGKQVGIVSWGIYCSYPGVYTRVAAVRDWIDQKTAA